MSAAELRRENERLMDQLIQEANDEIRDLQTMIADTERLIAALTRGEESCRVTARCV